VLDQAAIQDIISAVIAAVSTAVPQVPAAIVKQIREESERAARDISVAASGARRSIQDATKMGLQCLDVKINHHKVQTEKLVSAKKLAADRDWLAVLGTNHYFCVLCTNHSTLFTNSRQLKSSWIAGNGGVDPSNYRLGKPFPHQVHLHGESEMHKLAQDFDKDSARVPIATSFGQHAAHAEEVTQRLMRTAIDGVINYRVFNDYENLVYLQDLNGIDVGDWQHGR